MPDDLDTVNCACLMLTVTHARNGKRASLLHNVRPGASTHRVCDFARALVQLSVHHVRLPIPEGNFIPDIHERRLTDVPGTTLHTADGSAWDNPIGFSLLYTSSSDLIISERRMAGGTRFTGSISCRSGRLTGLCGQNHGVEADARDMQSESWGGKG